MPNCPCHLIIRWYLPGKQLILYTFKWYWITILDVRKKFAGIVKNLQKKSVTKNQFSMKWLNMTYKNFKFKLLYIVSNIKMIISYKNCFCNSSLENLSNRNWNACFTDSVSIRWTMPTAIESFKSVHYSTCCRAVPEKSNASDKKESLRKYIVNKIAKMVPIQSSKVT